jgi:hypothetical protein
MAIVNKRAKDERSLWPYTNAPTALLASYKPSRPLGLPTENDTHKTPSNELCTPPSSSVKAKKS